MKKALVLSFCAFFVLASIGCGKKKPDGMPDLQPTTLTLTQGGAPLAGATVNFKSTDSSMSWTCGGMTDDKGVATIVTHGQYKGAPVGKYKVAVNKTEWEGEAPPSVVDEASAKTLEEYKKAGKKYEEFYLVDLKYAIGETTPLEVEIVQGKNDLTADVGEPVHEKAQSSSGAGGVL